MLQEPSLLDFKTETEVNYAISNAFIYSMNIDKSKKLLDFLHWSAEQEVNSDLFVKSAPWHKGYRHDGTRYVPENQYVTVSDRPSNEEMSYTKRDKNLVEYFPKSILDPIGAQRDLSYKIIDNRVALLALSWWTMFISTKDGKRMIYYPYTSQIKDSINLNQFPSRNVWFKDPILSEYYSNLQIDLQKFPEIVSEEAALDFMYVHMKSFLLNHGLKFVLWLYNYIKVNNGVIPYNYSDEYLNSINDIPTYRNKSIVDINLNTPLAKSSTSRDNSQINGATGISQTGFTRDYHSCGIIINNPENISDLQFTNKNLKIRINGKIKLPRLLSEDRLTDRKSYESSQNNSRIGQESLELFEFFNGFNTLIPTNHVSSEKLEQYQSYDMSFPLIKRELQIVDEKNIRK